MKLLFKQRMFSWLCSYDVRNDIGDIVYTVRGQLSWGHCLKIFDAAGHYVGMVKERIFTFLPKFEIYLGDSCFGCISKEFSFFRPRFNIDFKGWHIEGDWMEWDYNINNSLGQTVATVSKQLFNWTDTYVINVDDPADTLAALMLVIAIDAEKCSRN